MSSTNEVTRPSRGTRGACRGILTKRRADASTVGSLVTRDGNGKITMRQNCTTHRRCTDVNLSFSSSLLHTQSSPQINTGTRRPTNSSAQLLPLVLTQSFPQINTNPSSSTHIPYTTINTSYHDALTCVSCLVDNREYLMISCLHFGICSHYLEHLNMKM